MSAMNSYKHNASTPACQGIGDHANKTTVSRTITDEKWIHGCRVFYHDGKVDVELSEDFQKNGMTPQQMGDLIIAELEMENKYEL